ncbi:hypothetical protein RRG08_043848 [Elysia crispata]|uniref:Uncharacterized protein n=1 Tax=Elysia crispata TaxID=231223 RepID=A0AAE1CMK9_9GAST|nr:hypothetical protein RRG08_043848 [Elysia crispata]
MVHIECLKGEIKNYEDMIGRSDSYCLKKKKIRRSPVRSFVQDSKVNSTTEVTPMNVAPTGLMEGIGATSLRAKSETFDPGQNRIVPRLSKILKRLPLEHLDYSQNLCYYKAPLKAYRCYRRYSRHLGQTSNDLAYRIKRKASSLRCTFRSMAKVCSKNRAFLLTIMEYDWMIVPPPLDVNIGYVLYRAWSMKL